MNCKAGIDFGTTFSTISALVDNKLTPLILEGSPYIPTVLTLFGGKIVIGDLAKTVGRNVTGSTMYYDLKRWVGVSEKNFDNLKNKIKPAYDCKFEKGDCLISGVGDRKVFYPVRSLISWYIKVLINLFEGKFKVKVTNLNVSVPADFYSSQRTYMRSIVNKLGITVDRILNEPSAAAIHTISSNPEFTDFIIYDFGGGTFDVSFVRKRGKIINICDTMGDPFLGGRDIDVAISKYILDKYDIEVDTLSLSYVKENVVNSNSTKFNILDSSMRLVNISFTKDELFRLCAPFSERASVITKTLIERNNVSNALISMVGGSSLLPRMQQDILEVSKATKNKMFVDKNLRLSVSYGCTDLHILLEDPEFQYIDVNSHFIYDLGMFFFPEILIRKPMPVPYINKIEKFSLHRFSTAVDMYEGESLFFLDNNLLVKDSYMTDVVAKIGEKYYLVIQYDLDANIQVYLSSIDGSKIHKLKSTSEVDREILPFNFEQTQISSVNIYSALFSLIIYYYGRKGFEEINLNIPTDIKKFVDSNGGIEKFIRSLTPYIEGIQEL
ncbi:heat shock protein 70-like protein [Cordyline virus 4]|uniref:Heat shock protein 70-like protein n=1 Tax=Cordyline virus 4 TaxID=1177753 RepID=L7P048_9CLOS|nr:heat shock protein 70-like protein [Cordyline virus 4]AFJ05063.2 heat shock protein 70-like protein [Cordyline virus 4]